MNKHILIIDDEQNIRRMERITLEAAGYEVGEAEDGIRGVEIYGDGSRWDAVLLDERMPGIDGLETLKRIRARKPTARVIMVTAYASVELAVDAMKLGAADFVRKPMTPETLRGALAAALSRQAKAGSIPASAVDEVAPVPKPIETITLNGFEILRPDDAGAATPAIEAERTFIVRSPDGKQSEVVVKIDEEALGFVERLTRRRLPAESSFWTYAAERLLADYLWNEGKTPAAALSLKQIGRTELATAERWRDSDR